MAFPQLIFVRHGETNWNVANRLQGRTDIALNPKGRDQADAVGRALAKLGDVNGLPFVSSPLARATETTRRVRAAMGLDPDVFTIDDRLAELSFGRWEGSTFADIRARETAEMKRRDADRWGHRPPGGESYVDVAERVGRFLSDLAGPAVVVSHGGVARAVLSLVGGADLAGLPTLHIRQGRAIRIGPDAWSWI